ncbi:hypothetical protein A3193_18520 [Candidatus Thiodiazotropha endoloripes]|uniref:hypothetical protein n=1 Tax=Candidatus Thiodiazotropha endoloripes TaxID=1818881 RepID=UPI00083D36F1|nr:hypothetical protein [Candidatus Thiodiazotropha endoloripes]ODB82744.1 hypothetical protein A3193_18520 [Candidatus Thiodiazotropha endoloripes]
MGKFASAVLGTAPQQIKPVSDSDRGAEFLDLAEAYRADDPGTRMRILAENRFPNLSEQQRTQRYRQTPEGIAYLGNDGKWYLEEPNGFWQGAKQFGASTLAHGESLLGSAGGAILGTVTGGPVGGLLGAALGGASGESSRKIHANLAYDEPQTPTGNLKSMAIEGGLAAAGEGAGQLLGRALSRKAVKDISRFDEVAANQLSRKANEAGITLTPAEITNLRSLINRQALLRDLPDSADIVEDFLKLRNKQVQRGVYQYLEKLSPEQTPHFAYKKGVNAAEGAREALEQSRMKASSPYYQDAANDQVDISHVLDSLKVSINKFSGTKVGKTLTQIEKALKNGEQPKNLIGQIDAVKGDLDDLIAKAKRDGRKTRLRELTAFKQELVSAMDQASPTYRTGRQIFEERSLPINELDNSLVGDMIREGSQAAPNLGKILFGRRSSPAAIKQAKRIITAHDPKAWNGVVRGHIQNTLEEMAESSVGEAANLGGVFRKRLMGTQSKQRMLKNALNKQQYQALMDLSDVLEATGRAMKGQSMTAQRTEMIKELRREATPAMSNAISPHRIPSKVAEWYQDMKLGKYSENLARIMTDPQGMMKLRTQVKLLKDISPREKQFYNALGAAVGVLIGNVE